MNTLTLILLVAGLVVQVAALLLFAAVMLGAQSVADVQAENAREDLWQIGNRQSAIGNK